MEKRGCEVPEEAKEALFVQCLQAAREAAERVEDPDDRFRAYMEIAKITKDPADLQAAREAAEEVAEIMGDPYYRSKAYREIAEALRSRLPE